MTTEQLFCPRASVIWRIRQSNRLKRQRDVIWIAWLRQKQYGNVFAIGILPTATYLMNGQPFESRFHLVDAIEYRKRISDFGFVWVDCMTVTTIPLAHFYSSNLLACNSKTQHTGLQRLCAFHNSLGWWIIIESMSIEICSKTCQSRFVECSFFRISAQVMLGSIVLGPVICEIQYFNEGRCWMLHPLYRWPTIQEQWPTRHRTKLEATLQSSHMAPDEVYHPSCLAFSIPSLPRNA